MIRIQKDDFDIAHEMALFKEGRSDIGALVSFTGLVRDSSDNQKIYENVPRTLPRHD